MVDRTGTFRVEFVLIGEGQSRRTKEAVKASADTYQRVLTLIEKSLKEGKEVDLVVDQILEYNSGYRNATRRDYKCQLSINP